MKQATVAGITVAMGPVLQGCGDPDPVPESCVDRSANQCITQNMESECAWDLETSEEACFLQPDFDEALFNATMPASEDFTNAPVDSSLNFEGCAEFDSVIAQRCLSQCEINPKYMMADGGANIRLDNLGDDYLDFQQAEVKFFLPNIFDDFEDTPESFQAEYLAGDASYIDLLRDCITKESTGFKPDWTPYGDLSDPRVQMSAQLGIQLVTLLPYDSRFDADSDNRSIVLVESAESKYDLGGKTLADWKLAAGEPDTGDYDTAAVVTYLQNNIFGDKEGADGKDWIEGLWLRFEALVTLHENGEPQLEVSIVQADLDANSFMLKSAFVDCSADRNCGVDFAAGQCVQLQDYCDQWTKETCPGDQTWSQKISMPTLATNAGEPPTNVDIGGGKERQVDGYKYYLEDATAKCQFYEDLSEGHCGLPDEFVTCETIGFPTQLGEENVCFFYDLQPVPWAAPVYDEDGNIVEGYDVNNLLTFASFYETVLDDNGTPVVLGELNPRGCITTGSPDLEGAEFLGSKYGYGGPVCTYPDGWDCLVNDHPDTEPGCNVTVTEGPDQGQICAYQEASFGECITSDQFYAKYFDDATGDALYESVTVVFQEIEEEDLDAEAQDGDEDGDEEMTTDRIA